MWNKGGVAHTSSPAIPRIPPTEVEGGFHARSSEIAFFCDGHATHEDFELGYSELDKPMIASGPGTDQRAAESGEVESDLQILNIISTCLTIGEPGDVKGDVVDAAFDKQRRAHSHIDPCPNHPSHILTRTLTITPEHAANTLGTLTLLLNQRWNVEASCVHNRPIPHQQVTRRADLPLPSSVTVSKLNSVKVIAPITFALVLR